MTHTTSAAGHTRTGEVVQYLMVRRGVHSDPLFYSDLYHSTWPGGHHFHGGALGAMSGPHSAR